MFDFEAEMEMQNLDFEAEMEMQNLDFEAEFEFTTIVNEGSCSCEAYNIGSGLKLDEATNTLSVDVAHDAEKDNTKPITSAAVYTEIGNIDALLKTI